MSANACVPDARSRGPVPPHDSGLRDHCTLTAVAVSLGARHAMGLSTSSHATV